MDYNPLNKADFKHTAFSRKNSRRRYRYIVSAIVLITGVAVIGMVLANSHRPAPTSTHTTDIPLALKPIPKRDENQAYISPRNPFASTGGHAAATEPVATPLKAENRTTIIIKKGDSLASIFTRLEVDSELPRVLSLGKSAKSFKKLYPGQRLHFTLGEDGINKLELEKSLEKSVFLYKDAGSFVVKETSRELYAVHEFATGTIDNSLFLAGQRAGLSDGLIMGLAGIFGWDIDFALDIRKGDSFMVLYEKLHLDGEKVRDGNIIAAGFVNRGKTYQAYRYTGSDGKTDYYTPDGKSMRKPFMRTPVEFTRISSHFNPRRRHPVLNRIRAHKGVDYAAPRGTPIKATGDGRIIYRGTKGNYGKTIILRHGSTYTTLYAHMSKYARGTSTGNRVKQGQTIGYIGSTGMSTGPHLHYEFRVNGVHRNPLKVKLPSAKSLPDAEIPFFQAAIRPLVVQLDAYARENKLVMRGL